MNKDKSNYPKTISALLDEHLRQKDSVRLSQRARQKLVRRLKLAYSFLPEAERTDVLIPDSASFLKKECVLIRYTRGKNNKNTMTYEFSYKWPTNGGFVESPPNQKDLLPGETYDRIGPAEGRNMCLHTDPPFTYSERALPYHIAREYNEDITTHPAFHVYEVTARALDSQIKMRFGTTKEAFRKKTGGGVQVTLIEKTDTIKSLKDKGILREKKK